MWSHTIWREGKVKQGHAKQKSYVLICVLTLYATSIVSFYMFFPLLK